ncbi:hypothetical protein ACIPSE_21320 [Streptomyces sp. NPDC090106]|uniref:hypothetical protein n=1 Tax=Streptomyces sp. NPDC090106 TaxID=3365946 RepID=UPI0037FD4BCA
MRLFRTVAAGAATAILGLTGAGVATAVPPSVEAPLGDVAGSAEVVPATARPGQSVQIYTKACTGRSATADSLAFAATAKLTPGANSLTGTARIKPDLAPGPYVVNIDCEGGGTAEAAVEVIRAEPTPTKCPGPAEFRQPCGGGHPSGPVHAGGGARAAQTFEPGGSGGVLGMAGAGVLAAAGLALIVVRRRRREP